MARNFSISVRVSGGSVVAAPSAACSRNRSAISPTVRPPTDGQLLQAAEWLANDRQARFSFGSSFDGGFWLFGGNCPIPRTLWTDVAYSAADTGAQFLGKLKGVGEVQYLTPLRDVDEACDLVVLHETLEGMPHLLPEQRELLRFLETLPRSLFLNC